MWMKYARCAIRSCVISTGRFEAAAVFGIAEFRTGLLLAFDLDFVFVVDLEFLAMTVTPYNLLAAIAPTSVWSQRPGKKGI
jgi:hypothetical protein